MLVLALDTATPASTAALVEVTADGLAGVVERRTVDPRAHGERLAPEIAAVLADAGFRPRDLAAIVAGVGPGPFTGLRVGLATAASMGQALAIPTYGVCSLDALGRAAGPGRVLIATDARRREVYFATYTDGVRVTGPEVAKPADVAALVAGAVGSALPAGLLVSAEEMLAAGAEGAGASGAAGAEGAGASGAAGAAGTGASRAGKAAGTGASRAAGSAGAGTSLAGLVERAAGEGALKYGDVFGVPVEEHLLYPPGAALVAIAADRIRTGAPSEILTPLYLRRPDAVEPSARKPVLT
ncbi:tRNA (adenosine(37)-N6)-threonylcarbamoyltransferase complex dimerization subunit type 1 TsaB [Actinoplanes sp. G11-F43]|uniref:tRNA (adenosine(37)-N6)-threonylcarbamoyltransferase complex dimerization subunit type 1 TsaB n=1 Tax=Actinoplanes sp. G11-F43 TaxID=3424130 RepID=UPI003D345F10